ncbi:MAG: NADH-quinone oxidoreductase subunit C [Deltaproteobacteria bacterium]|nr:NADH-quinone oxidoreductase subunit C [Deltaproteobacteria bacterium]
MNALGVCLANGVPAALDTVPCVDVAAWRQWIIETCKGSTGRIVALFADAHGDRVRLYAIIGMDLQHELWLAATEVCARALHYPSLTPDLPEAHWFERELYEESGVVPQGHPWLKPLRTDRPYPFYRVDGEGIHEVAVGPVHAGIIEPGHFRFQCHGEKIFHLEIQLGYQHRGVESLLLQAPPARRAILAESIAGDTVIGHMLAHAHVVEQLAGRAIPARAEGLRVIALELERLANHVGDLGMLSADIGFLTAANYFGRLRGEFLNLLMALTGNRYGRSFIRPGGVLLDLSRTEIAAFQKRLTRSAKEVQAVARLFFSATSVLDRLEQTGIVETTAAQALGLVGPAARASGLHRDVRHDYPTGDYRSSPFPLVRLTTGDVYARARIRGLEVQHALDFLQRRLKSLPQEKIFLACGAAQPSAIIVSLVEGWRGEIAHVAITDRGGAFTRYKIVDPSFHNWMGLQIAMRGGQISDFPLCNKSFNLSYAGHDL